MNTCVLFMIASVFLEMIYFIFEERLRAKINLIVMWLYAIITSKEMLYYFVTLADFLIALGPSVTAVAVVGMFIPIKDVTIVIVTIVFISGILITMFGAFVKKILKRR